MNKLFIAILFFACSPLRAQLLFTTLKPSDGLSSRETRCVFRDREGYVWTGTNNGLNRFDGAHFKLWNKLSAGYPVGLGEVVTSIIEDAKGKIWFGTNAGIGVLDKAGNHITEVKIAATNKGQPVSISRLQHDAQGKLWAGTNIGLLVEQNSRLVPVSQIYSYAKELDNLSCIGAAFVFDALRNCFWIGTTTGSYCLDFKKGKLFSAADNPDASPFFTKDVILSIALDDKSNLWFSNAAATSLCHYNFNTRVFQKITHINNNPAWWLNGGCNSLYFDKQGRLWISTWLYNTFVRYPNGRFEEIPYNKNLPHSIGYGFFSEAFQDRYSNIWLATINGLSKLQASRFVENIIEAPSFKFYLPTGFANINCVQLDEEGDYWLGKMDGLVKYNVASKSFERFAVSETDLPRNEVSDVEYINGEVWCATNKGIQILNPETKSFRTFKYEEKGKGEVGGVWWILPARDGTIWFSIRQKGLYYYNPGNGKTHHFSDSVFINSNCAFESSDGKIWIGTFKEGLRIFDPATQQFLKPPPSLLTTTRLTSVTEDGDKNIWIGFIGKGLIKCNRQGVVIDSINRKDGLPVVNFNEICTDASGRLWTVSRENMLCILPATKEITKVDIPANFSFNDHWNALIRKGSLLYAAMLDNVVVINTDYYQRLPQHASPLLSGFQVFGKETPVQESGTIELNYNQNFFSFDFASPFHQEALSMQYAYRLRGFDKEWVQSGRNLTAAYTNVPDGDYTFLVRTTDERGKWMQETSSVHIHIRAPFWKRWWFITLLAMGVAFTLYFLYRLRQKQKREKRIDETIDYFANSLYGENSVNEICWDIARNCISQLKLEDCVVYLLDEKRNVLVQKAAYGPKNPKEHEISNPIDIAFGEGIVGLAAATGKPVIIKDTTKDNRYIVDDAARLSELAVPIIHEGKAIGVIDSEHPRRNFFTDEHVKVLSTIAAISANKIAEAKAEEAARESQIQLLEIKKLLAESQLMALRAQMNPHFVFNCLNSIQECIVTQKYGEASLYLNKFSKLFRSVLNNSGKIMVTLAEEIEVLDLYLTLEHMRFEGSFEYLIYTDEELEDDEILIPSMLVQPYVENALWHGLMHKEGNRNLFIAFNKKEGDTFECVIEDNGVGRKKAAALKEQQRKTKRHVSKGMTISKDRIELLQKQGQHAQLNIVDKYNEAGEATGTKVVVELSSFLQ